jgi:GNAT superfamily N-acetyltransferase
MRIRQFTTGDSDACLAIFDSNVPAFFWEAERAAFVDFLLSPGDSYYVVEEGNRVVACGGWFVRANTDVAGLSWGMVAKECHGQGIGKFLLRERLRLLRLGSRASRVRLTTTSAVRGFFEKAGFLVQGPPVPGIAEGTELLEMWLDLTIVR